MLKALRAYYAFLLATIIVGRAVRMKSEQNEIAELAESSINIEEPLKCPLFSPSKKDYYFDIPAKIDTGMKVETIAVHLVRDPKAPKLIIYEDAIWTITQKVNKKQAEGDHEMVPVGAGGTKADGVVYDLTRDMVSLTKAVSHFEFATTKCAGRSYPKRPSRSSDLDGANITAAQAVKAPGVAGKPSLVTDKAKRRTKSRGSKAKSSKRKTKSSGSKSVSSLAETLADILRSNDEFSNTKRDGLVELKKAASDKTCQFKLEGGTYYQTQILKGEVQRRVKNAHWKQVRFKASEVKQVKNLAPTIAKAIFQPALAGLFGYFAPLWYLVESGVRWAPIWGGAAVGLAGIPAIIIANSDIQHQGRLSRMSASEILFEKLYCLTKVDSCKTHPCFKQCTDSNKSLSLMPYDREAEGGIVCRCGKDLNLRC